MKCPTCGNGPTSVHLKERVLAYACCWKHTWEVPRKEDPKEEKRATPHH